MKSSASALALLLLMMLALHASSQDAPLPPAPTPPPAEETDEEAAPDPERPKPPKPSDWAQWNDVERFRGYYEYRRVNDMYRGDDIGMEAGYTEFVGTARFELALAGMGQHWALVKGETSGSWRSTGATHRWSYHGRSSQGGVFQGACPDMRFNLDTKRGTWTFSPADQLSQTYTVTSQLSSRSLEGSRWVENNRTSSEERKSYPACSMRGALETGRPGPLVGVWTITNTKTERKGWLTDNGRARVILVPEYKDVELVVEVEGLMGGGRQVAYEKWIPRGTAGGAPGSRLMIKARLQARDGGAIKARADHFTFRLEETSREPGVCLNFPRVRPPTAEKPATFDLKFGPGGTADAGRQTLDVLPLPDDLDHPHAEAHVDCFDYGAWANLSVTAVLADGRIVTGHLKGDPSAIVIPLPKRSGGSRIADAWKEEQGVSAGDEDDQEKLPSAGKEPGDGFTLYEEYRGFVENGKHLPGDPKKIDFFVRNYVGGDAVPGIELFGEITGAVVHRRLRDAEFDKNKRVMNRNHHQGPHAVDQHGVYLVTEAGLDGGKTVGKEGVRFRPGLTQYIALQPREAATSITTSENVPASDLMFAYDIAVVHELLHSVGVVEHGAGDYTQTFRFIFSDDPRNGTGKPHFVMGGSRIPVTILDEATGRNLAAMMEPDQLLEREKWRPEYYPACLERVKSMLAGREGIKLQYTLEELTQIELNDTLGATRRWYVGAERGECSGQEGCAMRYYFAGMYEKKSDPSHHTFYYIGKKPSERAGFALCRSAAGTGVNAAGRKPQSRYGDTKPGWGPCADWIVFNDAVPPDPEPK